MKHTVYKVEAPEGVYVGVTKTPLWRRLAALRCASRIDGKISAIAAFENRADAFALERELRPRENMGLNRGRGGPCFNQMRVRVDGVEYPTLLAAAQAHGLSKTAAHYRFGSPYFLTWEYVTPTKGAYWRKEFARKQRIPNISAALQGGSL